jgi:molybdopterin synthase catalytic subunit
MRARFGVERARVVHRVGICGIGEPSVAIAVAAPHRAAAFDACRYCIDELKKRVPIWKREVYESGAEWVGDRS